MEFPILISLKFSSSLNICMKLFLLGVSTGSKDCRELGVDSFVAHEALPGLVCVYYLF